MNKNKVFLGISKPIIVFVCVAGIVVIGFLAFILIGVGQHHPPHSDEQLAESSADWADCYLTDTVGVHLLPPAELPKGSWWTDGQRYYQVVSTGKTIRMEGMTLHEGGLVAEFTLQNDSLWVAAPKGGISCFAEDGCLVRWHRIAVDALGDSIKPEIELLVAYDKANHREPIAVLQRFDGDELKFETESMHALLEGTYADDKGTEWIFLLDGTMKLKASGKPQPYRIEQFYHALTNVIMLPNGQHVALSLTADNRLKVMETRYDTDEEAWLQAEPQKVLMLLTKKDDESWQADKPFWGNQRLLTPGMTQMLDEDYSELLSQYRDLAISSYPFGLLNYRLLYQWSVRENQEGAAEELENGVALDSITIKTDQMKIAMTLKADYPVADTELQRQLAQHIAQQMFSLEDEGGRIIMPIYKGDFKAFLQACAKQKRQELTNETYGPEDNANEDGIPRKELTKDEYDENGEKIYLTTYSLVTRKVHETAEHITWQTTSDVYVCNTAHPSMDTMSITFRKTDGRPLSQSVLKNADH